MPEIKNIITRMEKASARLITRLDLVEERTLEFEDLSIKASKTKKQKEENGTEYLRIVNE